MPLRQAIASRPDSYPRSIKRLLPCALLLLAGCASPGSPSQATPPAASAADPAFHPKGELLASIKVTATAFSGPVQGETGFFFYLDQPARGGYVTFSGYKL